MSLKLPGHLGAPDHIAEDPTWRTYETVIDRLKNLGIRTDPLHPGDEFPHLKLEELTTANTQEFSGSYYRCMEWWRYTNELLADFQAQKLERVNEYNDLVLRIKREGRKTSGTGRAGKPTKEELEEDVAFHPRAKVLKQDIQGIEQAIGLLEVKMDTLKENLKVVSRQITLRQVDIEQGRIEGNIPKRPGPEHGSTSPQRFGRRFGQ